MASFSSVKNIHSSFSATEIKRLYWSFKSECPSGLVNQETFHEIYSKFFPVGGKPHIHIRISLCPCSRSSFLYCEYIFKRTFTKIEVLRRRPLFKCAFHTQETTQVLTLDVIVDVKLRREHKSHKEGTGSFKTLC